MCSGAAGQANRGVGADQGRPFTHQVGYDILQTCTVSGSKWIQIRVTRVMNHAVLRIRIRDPVPFLTSGSGIRDG